MLQLFDILMQGISADAFEPVTVAEAARVAPHWNRNETFEGAARGREATVGSALWLLSSERLMLSRAAKGAQPRSLALRELSAFSAETGRYGVTLRVQALSRTHALLHADPVLAAAMTQALARLCPQLPIDSNLPELKSAERAEAAAAHATGRARLHPQPGATVGEVMVLLREAEAMRQRGVLSEMEFGLLKGRLLQAA